MPSLELFGASIALSLIDWGVVTASYFWPELREDLVRTSRNGRV